MFRLLPCQLHVLHELSEVLQRGVVRVCVGEGRIVSVDVERHREQLRHDAVVSYQRRQAAVHFQETLTVRITLLLSDCLTMHQKCVHKDSRLFNAIFNEIFQINFIQQ